MAEPDFTTFSADVGKRTYLQQSRRHLWHRMLFTSLTHNQTIEMTPFAIYSHRAIDHLTNISITVCLFFWQITGVTWPN